MAATKTRLTCPECGDELYADEEWLITDRSIIGKDVGDAEDAQGDYAHARCLRGDTDAR